MNNMRKCNDCNCYCGEMKFDKGAYIPLAANCKIFHNTSSFCKNKKEIVKTELDDIFISNNEILELNLSGENIGFFTTDKTEKGVFSLYSDFIGQNDNDKFYIVNNKLKANQTFYYPSGSSYKISVRYEGLKYYKNKDFTVLINSSKDVVVPPVGEQIQVSSSDNSTQLIFDNIINSGIVTIEPVYLQNNDLNIFYIQTYSEFEGNIKVFFNTTNNPAKTPYVFYLRYDPDSEEVFYEDITTDIEENRVSGITNSLGAFLVFYNNVQTFNYEVISKLDIFGPPQAWGGAPNCGFTLDYTPPPPCPGNQTKGNWAITEDGIGPPRLLGGTCGCWEPSFITVDTIIGAATAVGAAKAGICVALKNLTNVRAIISGLLNSLSEIRQIVKSLSDEISEMLLEIKNKDALLEELEKQLFSAESRRDNILIPGINELDKEIESIRELLTSKYGALPSQDIPDNLVNKFYTLIDEKPKLTSEISKLDDLIETRGIDVAKLEDKISDINIDVNIKKTELKTKSEELLSKELELNNSQNLLKSHETGYLDSLKNLAASTLAMYAFVNEISVQKTCPENQTLNPLTCECCPNCTNGKIFPDPMNGCNCSCPPDKQPCLSINDDNCYDPCPFGQIRVSPDCQCKCLEENQVVCNDSCYDSCPEGKIFNENCECVDPPYFWFASKSEDIDVEW